MNRATWPAHRRAAVVALSGIDYGGHQVDAGPDVARTEGATLTQTSAVTDTDSTSWTATVDYGDGTGVQALGINPDRTFTLSRVYAENGAYTLTVSVIDAQGNTGTDRVLIIVNNVPPSINSLTAGDAGRCSRGTLCSRTAAPRAFRGPSDRRPPVQMCPAAACRAPCRLMWLSSRHPSPGPPCLNRRVTSALRCRC
jgi:PKD domain